MAERRFPCVDYGVCAKAYTQKQALIEHVRTLHLGQRLFCLDCGISFATLKGASRHQGPNAVCGRNHEWRFVGDEPLENNDNGALAENGGVIADAVPYDLGYVEPVANEPVLEMVVEPDVIPLDVHDARADGEAREALVEAIAGILAAVGGEPAVYDFDFNDLLFADNVAVELQGVQGVELERVQEDEVERVQDVEPNPGVRRYLEMTDDELFFHFSRRAWFTSVDALRGELNGYMSGFAYAYMQANPRINGIVRFRCDLCELGFFDVASMRMHLDVHEVPQ